MQSVFSDPWQYFAKRIFLRHHNFMDTYDSKIVYLDWWHFLYEAGLQVIKLYIMSDVIILLCCGLISESLGIAISSGL